jgi:hypothetical protein
MLALCALSVCGKAVNIMDIKFLQQKDNQFVKSITIQGPHAFIDVQ